MQEKYELLNEMNEQIKSGAPCRSERLCKYNEFLRLEEELVSDSHNHVFYNMKPVENTF